VKIVSVRAKTCRIETQLYNARGSRTQSAVTLLAAVTDVVRSGRPVIGFSFSGTGFLPPTAQLQDRFSPRILALGDRELDLEPAAFDPAAALAAITKGEKFGGDAERSTAVGTLEVAIWDAVAKIAGLPAYQLIAQKYGRDEIKHKIECYVGGGWYGPKKTTADLHDEVARYLELGYRTVKVKVGGLPVKDDLARLDMVLSQVGDPSRLAVDANSALGPDRRSAYAQALKGYNLRWFEEPAHPNDYQANADFIAEYGNPVATGENQFSLEELRNLVRYGGMRPGKDLLQWDIPHCYGVEMTSRIIAMLADYGWSVDSMFPHGGNQIALNACGAFGFGACEAYPDAFGAFSGYADNLKVQEGFISLGDWEGFGFEAQSELFAEMKALVPEYYS
jgi:L-alanine-DL-glutamate epimerase-like enolase superfamily enzyme